MDLKELCGITEAKLTGKRDELYQYPLTNVLYNNVAVSVFTDSDDKPETVVEHLYDDFNVMLKEGIEKIVKERFIFWLNGNKFTEEDQKLYEGLKLYSIVYSHPRIIEQYSPTGEEGVFGKFELEFEAGNEYAMRILQASCLEVFVQNGKVVGTKCYDI